MHFLNIVMPSTWMHTQIQKVNAAKEQDPVPFRAVNKTAERNIWKL